jgi:hypothetical protein
VETGICRCYAKQTAIGFVNDSLKFQNGAVGDRLEALWICPTTNHFNSNVRFVTKVWEALTNTRLEKSYYFQRTIEMF